MPKNAEVTKSKILFAATDEFAAFGFAGARVDRIAANAGCNKQLIYGYFGGKQELFDAVAKTHIRAVLDAVPIDANNLPQYAARLFDYNQAHPHLLRLIEWFNLEGVNAPSAIALTDQSMLEKIQAIRAAQETGIIQSTLPAEELLAIILAISGAWNIGIHHWQTTDEQTEQQIHRQSIVETVQKLIAK